MNDLARLPATGDLSDLSPEAYIQILPALIEDLCVEFGGVTVRISKDNLPVVVATLARGLEARGLSDPLSDPGSLPSRMRSYGAAYPAVELRLNREAALLLAQDIEAGAQAA